MNYQYYASGFTFYPDSTVGQLFTYPRPAHPAHFLYDPPKAALLNYCAHWATFNHAKQLFVKFLDPPGLVSALLPSPSFCVIRLSFETVGFVIVQLAFFSTDPVTRAETVASLKHDLAAISYPASTAERERIGANPVSESRALTLGAPVVPMAHLVRALLVRYDPSTAHSSHSYAQHNQLRSHHNPARLVFHPTATPAPSYFPFLAWYMLHHRWVWVLPDASIAEQILGMILECRLKEGFVLINVAHSIYTFVKEIPLQLPHSSSASAVPCILQYVVFLAHPHSITIELFMEPQHGRHKYHRGEITETELFATIRAWCEETDSNLISAISTLYLLGSADIREKKLDLSSYPLPSAHHSTLTTSVSALISPPAPAHPPRRLDILSTFASEKHDHSYPVLISAFSTTNTPSSSLPATPLGSPVVGRKKNVSSMHFRYLSMKHIHYFFRKLIQKVLLIWTPQQAP